MQTKESFTNPTAAGECRAPADTSDSVPSPTATSSALLSRIRRWYHFSVLRLLVVEIRNCVPRIEWVLRIRAGKDREVIQLEKDSSFLAVGCYTHAHTRYMQGVRRDFPFLSVFDRLLLASAWKAGWETCACMGMSLDESQRHSLVPLAISPEGALTNLTLDMLKRQWYKSQYESSGHSNPSQSNQLPD
jgi:hypothetical protein